MRTNFKRLFSAIVLFWAMIAQLVAAPITGEITMVGGASLNGSLTNATQINSFSAPPIVISVDGDLALFANPSDPVLFPTLPFVFGVSTPYPTLYSVGGWNFKLFSSSINTQNANFLAIVGVGELSGNGYDPTPADFKFSTQSPSAGGIFSFSAASSAVSVPDGGSTLLLSMIPLSAFFAFKKLNGNK